MKEINVHHMASYSLKNNYINRAILEKDGKYYIGKHWIYYIHYLESIRYFLDDEKIKKIKIVNHDRLFDRFDKVMHEKKEKDLMDEFLSMIVLFVLNLLV